MNKIDSIMQGMTLKPSHSGGISPKKPETVRSGTNIPIPPKKAEIGAIKPERVSLFLSEWLRAYAFADFDAPSEEILVAMSTEAAAEIKAPDLWVPRLFLLARKEFRAVPKLNDLSECYKLHLKEEINEAIRAQNKANKPQIQESEKLKPEEEFEVFKRFFTEIHIFGGKLSQETRKKYDI